jgi:rod shape-determining protein MreD
MVRSALASRPIGKGPVAGAQYVPAATVIVASALAVLPVMSLSGWWPNLGLLTLISWRMLRADCFPAWWAAPLGFANDLLTGSPLGLSIALWPMIMLAMDLVDRRTQWRDYWIEWAVASALIAAGEWAEWQSAGLAGAPVPIISILPPLLISVLAFPLIGMLTTRLDAWRLGR